MKTDDDPIPQAPLAQEATQERPPSTLTASVFTQLRTEILSGRLQPGAKLRADSLRKRFSTGSSPVREALNRLLAEGLVALQEQKGFRVAPISREDLVELVSARVLIDSTAIAESIRRFESTWEEGLVLALHHLSRTPREEPERGTATQWEIRHKAFHMALIAGCGSRWMRRISEQLFDTAERYRQLALQWIPERNELDEHRALVEACIGRDPDTASTLIKSHYAQTFDAVVASGLI